MNLKGSKHNVTKSLCVLIQPFLNCEFQEESLSCTVLNTIIAIKANEEYQITIHF